jgi:hypothetical protein
MELEIDGVVHTDYTIPMSRGWKNNGDFEDDNHRYDQKS